MTTFNCSNIEPWTRLTLMSATRMGSTWCREPWVFVSDAFVTLADSTLVVIFCSVWMWLWSRQRKKHFPQSGQWSNHYSLTVVAAGWWSHRRRWSAVQVEGGKGGLAASRLLHRQYFSWRRVVELDLKLDSCCLAFLGGHGQSCRPARLLEVVEHLNQGCQLVRHFVFRIWTNQMKSEELSSLLPLTFSNTIQFININTIINTYININIVKGHQCNLLTFCSALSNKSLKLAKKTMYMIQDIRSENT